MTKTVKCTCFTVIFIVLLLCVSSIISFKTEDGTYITEFYEQDEDTIDVLVVGSSHAYMDINPAILWDEYGIASYVLGGGNQPIWCSYHHIVEALKTQHPRLIILEGYCLYPRDIYAKSTIIENNYGLKWSGNRIASLQASTVPWEFKDYLLTFNQLHNRYSDLSEKDFRLNSANSSYANWKGYKIRTQTQPLHRPDAADITYSIDLDDKIELYYRKILELAQDENIPIMVMVAPYALLVDTSQATYNRGAEIASEYGVDFYNFNLDYDSYNLDFATDCADEGHLNYLGSAKLSQYLGTIIMENYPDSYVDRRDDERYVSWDRNAADYERSIHNLKIAQAENIADAIDLANNENYMILLSISSETEESNTMVDALMRIGIDLGATNGVWTWSGGDSPEKIENLPLHIEPVMYDDLLITNSDKGYQFELDHQNLTAVENGTNLLIYDKATACVITTMGF